MGSGEVISNIQRCSLGCRLIRRWRWLASKQNQYLANRYRYRLQAEKEVPAQSPFSNREPSFCGEALSPPTPTEETKWGTMGKRVEGDDAHPNGTVLIPHSKRAL